MKKLVFPFVEIEVPDDFPDGLDPEATFEYAGRYPELAERICREYEVAYYKWQQNQNNSKPHAKKK